MGFGDRRARRREERETFGHAGSARRYRMREKLLSIGDDFWIEDEQGERIFRVDGKALRLRKTFHLEDMRGERLCTIQKRVMHIRDTMEIEGPDGARIALVHKALISPLRERWKIDVEDGPDLEARGNIVDHEYEIEAGDRKVAQVSKRWFRVRDTYGVEMAPDQDPALLLAVTVAIDDMTH
ncbi:LURP-one-related/scramblase family protein [Actinoplanes aureus]|jgi:uncharacterized protein YxjI|uniref:LURP-one-related family protein n=1 Tax=Actinoplanes aureus TaxID=2792083 RepID=A0A931C762_9ACTN|nr:LURP-one-related family protein [Actinoplanes aureus]MBG0561326.1 LURP-one-related family protein [Actinoplanes aureus]